MAACRRVAVACLLIVVLMLGGGCGDRDASRPREHDEKPVPGGTVVIGIGSEPDVLNSLTRTTAVAGQVLSLMQAGLAEMGEDLQWQPMIADRWELAPDSLAITFHLRPWRWSDGMPLTARDVVASYELLIDPRVGSPRAGQVEGVLYRGSARLGHGPLRLRAKARAAPGLHGPFAAAAARRPAPRSGGDRHLAAQPQPAGVGALSIAVLGAQPANGARPQPAVPVAGAVAGTRRAADHARRNGS